MTAREDFINSANLFQFVALVSARSRKIYYSYANIINVYTNDHDLYFVALLVYAQLSKRKKYYFKEIIGVHLLSYVPYSKLS